VLQAGAATRRLFVFVEALCLLTSMELEPAFSQVPTQFQEHASLVLVGLTSSLGTMPAASQTNINKD
jgi:hypothetical protein